MSLAKSYLALVAVVLLGYAFFDKGFAYIGYAPVYVGEVTLSAGLLVLLCGGFSSAVLRSPITWAILAFALWGALNTLPYFDTYGVLALRDGVVWGYATFALFVAGALLRTGLIERTLLWYGRWLPWFLIWVPVAFLIVKLFSDYIPVVPGSDIGMLTVKAGDMAVHLAGAAAFLTLGLHLRFRRRPGAWLWLKEWAWWLFWSIGFLAVASSNRAGMVAVLTALAVVMVLRPANRMYKLLFVGIVISGLSIALDIRIPLGTNLEMSPQQIFENMEGMFFESPRPGGEGKRRGTIEWRLRWWQTILDYTVFGDHFWTGKGYGINLADSDGFRATGVDAARARHPHNIHFTILARSGVPGLALWVLLQATVFLSLLRAYFRARGAGRLALANVNLWLMAYWVAFIVNSTFDVYLEGPQGGIWFWSLIGYVIALTEAQKSKVSVPAPLPFARTLAAGGPPPGSRNYGRRVGLREKGSFAARGAPRR